MGEGERGEGLLAPGVVVGLLLVESCGFAMGLKARGLGVCGEEEGDRFEVSKRGNRGFRGFVLKRSALESCGMPRVLWVVLRVVGEASPKVSSRRPVLPRPRDLLAPTPVVLRDSFGRCLSAMLGSVLVAWMGMEGDGSVGLQLMPKS